METIQKVVETINMYLSDYISIILLIGTGVFFTIKTKFVQIRCFKEGFKNGFGEFSLNGKKSKDKLNAFQALATSVATQLGTGNIVGASGAILLGGPGAIFWMWIIAFLGMATIYAETILAQETRIIKDDGSVLGGPVYYIKRAFPNKFGDFLAKFFAVAITIALGFIGSMVLSNSIAETCRDAFGIPAIAIGIILVILLAFILIGGITRIASVSEKLVPFMSIMYMIGSIIILAFRWRFIPETFVLIFKYAFCPQAILGGGLGYALKKAISNGAKRGLFSNEAGMGSTPHINALVKDKTPHEQGTVSMISVFIDTFVILTLTALVVISTLYVGDGVLANGAVDGISQTNMPQLAFGSIFGNSIGSIFVAICLAFFAFTSIYGWNLYGKINMQYLFGDKILPYYFIISLVFVFLGSYLSNTLVWDLSDLFNQLMVIPNVMALIKLSDIVVAKCKRDKKN